MPDHVGRAVELHRVLDAKTAVAIVVGTTIGSGIYFKPGTIAAEAGSFPLIIGVWILGGVLCLLGACSFAELGAMFPKAGGLYVYLRETYGELTAFLFGWSESFLAKPAAIAALTVAFAKVLFTAAGWHESAPLQIALAVVLIGGLALVNCCGVVWGGRVQLAITIIKAGSVAGIAVLPFALLPFVDQSVDWSNYASTAPPRQASLAGQIGAVLLAVMWAYHGWHGVTPLAEEIHDPQRNVPLALIGGLGILMLLYVSANLAYHGVLSMSELQAAGQRGAERTLTRLVGPLGGGVMAAIIMCSTFGAMNSNLLESPRVAYAMGRDGVFFRWLGQVHATTRTPVPAILITAAISIAFLAAAAVGKVAVVGIDAQSLRWTLPRRVVTDLQGNTIFDLLTNFVVFSSSVFHMLVVLAVFILRHRQPNRPRPYRTFGYPVVPAVFLLVYAWFLWQACQDKLLETQVGIVLLAVGVPVYWLFRSRQRSAA